MAARHRGEITLIRKRERDSHDTRGQQHERDRREHRKVAIRYAILRTSCCARLPFAGKPGVLFMQQEVQLTLHGYDDESGRDVGADVSPRLRRACEAARTRRILCCACLVSSATFVPSRNLIRTPAEAARQWCVNLCHIKKQGRGVDLSLRCDSSVARQHRVKSTLRRRITNRRVTLIFRPRPQLPFQHRSMRALA